MIDKRQCKETIDLAFNAWYQTQREEIGNRALAWQQGYGRRPGVCKSVKGVDRRTLVSYDGHKCNFRQLKCTLKLYCEKKILFDIITVIVEISRPLA